MFYNLPGQKYDLSSHVNRYSHSKQKTYITKSSKSPASIAKSTNQLVGTFLYQIQIKKQVLQYPFICTVRPVIKRIKTSVKLFNKTSFGHTFRCYNKQTVFNRIHCAADDVLCLSEVHCKVPELTGSHQTS